jgi:hypothetical protein
VQAGELVTGDLWNHWSNHAMLTPKNAQCTLEPLGMCFMTTPYHLPVKRPETRASYLKRVTRGTEKQWWLGSARCDAKSPHDLSDPAHEAVRAERARHAEIVPECWLSGRTRLLAAWRSD